MPTPAADTNVDAFTDAPTPPDDPALVTAPLPDIMVLRDDEAVTAESSLLAEKAQSAKTIVEDTMASGSAVLLGNQGDALPNFVGRVLSLSVRRARISEEAGRGQKHIGNAHLLRPAGLALAKAYQVSVKARAVMRGDMAELLADLARLHFRQRLLGVIDRARAAVDRGVVESENGVFTRITDNWLRLAGLIEASPGMAIMLQPVAAFMNANAEKAAETRFNRDLGRAEGRSEERARIEELKKAPPAPAPSTVTIQPGAAPPAATPPAAPATPAVAPTRRRAERNSNR